MLSYAREAAAMASRYSRADLDSDRIFALALVRLLEVVGEAASQVSAGERARHPEVPWSRIIAFRNRIIHGYFSVDYDILWAVTTQDLAPLIATLEQIVPAEDEEP
jgi:uncharacterized protein with HEPN domain